MKRLIFETNNSMAPFFLRMFSAIVLFPHGAQKLLGWFDGYGFEASMQYFSTSVGLPKIVGFLIILIEFFGPLALLLGFAVRIWSLLIAGLMTGILLTTHTGYFFMNWFGNQKTEGMEYFLLFIAITVSLVYSGAGRFSVDAKLQTGKKKRNITAKIISG